MTQTCSYTFSEPCHRISMFKQLYSFLQKLSVEIRRRMPRFIIWSLHILLTGFPVQAISKCSCKRCLVRLSMPGLIRSWGLIWVKAGTRPLKMLVLAHWACTVQFIQRATEVITSSLSNHFTLLHGTEILMDQYITQTYYTICITDSASLIVTFVCFNCLLIYSIMVWVSRLRLYLQSYRDKTLHPPPSVFTKQIE